MKITIDGRDFEVSEAKANELKEMLGVKQRTLAEIPIGDTFFIGDMEFIKFAENDGRVTAVMKNSVFKSAFNDTDNNNFNGSKIHKRLEKEILPKIEKIVGAENVLEFETDLFTIDGLKIHGTMRSKISLPTFDFYRANRKIFDKHKLDEWWWLATANDEDTYVTCVSPHGRISDFNCSYDDRGVRPFLIFLSDISVS